MKKTPDNWTIFIQCRRNEKTVHRLFRNIWYAYYQRLFYFVRQMAGENEAEDLLQEIMLKIFNNLQSYNPLHSFTSWVYAIARNHCINFLRFRKTFVQTGLDNCESSVVFSTDPTAEQNLIYSELDRTIETCLNNLDSDYRQMAFLRFYEGMKFKEIAQLLDVPAGTVKSRIHLIKKELRKKLEQFYEN